MDSSNALGLLFAAAGERGFAASIVGAGRIAEAVEDLERARELGAIDATVWEERLAAVREPLPEGLDVRSLILFAIPSSEVRVAFQRERSIELTLPPTYAQYGTLPEEIAAWAGALLEPHGFRVVPAGRIPLKTLAVRSGLGRYGRNNLCYVPGMGSWGHLVALYANLEPPYEVWREPILLDRCASCRACAKVCPGDAISTETVPLRVERCVTFHTERPAQMPLPDWKRRPACVFGCMDCQTYCPVNRALPRRTETGPAFDEKETTQLLDGAPLEDLGEDTLRKLRRLDWIEPYDLLRRNLTGLLQQSAES
ncbi:MAG TPA: 4Fe-4S double cluster binding domain-containing protein [Thermoanaerobaculia bacterium]|nr:4Fe-4S double cluster binding domain-containing protein [Thermoanaerobaculia bacterium]